MLINKTVINWLVSELVAIRRENVHLDDGFVKLEAAEIKTRRTRVSVQIPKFGLIGKLPKPASGNKLPI
ncbi:hypothetical protein JMM81_07115 [Bacillus sp. V3B]|nr:hypothetical protein [Bacillus sp. V3B]